MILQVLNDYYERLAEDPGQEIPPYGYSVQKMSFCIVLSADGRLVQFKSLVSEVAKRRIVVKAMIVPGQSKPPGIGVNPCFLWDNVRHLLGFQVDDPNPKRTATCFESFRAKHLLLEDQIDDAQFSSVCRFLESWDPAHGREYSELGEIAQRFGCFQVQGETSYVHDQPKVRRWWKEQESSDSRHRGVCLVSGELHEIARLHAPKLKGVNGAGAQSSGGVLVSFNHNAFESYGKKEGDNSPISEQSAFQYATALNQLLADTSRTITLGDATVVFWTSAPTDAEVVFPSFFSGPLPTQSESEDAELLTRLKSFLSRLSVGKRDELGETFEAADTPFYILGLSPNAARVSIRFWQVSSVGEMAKRLARYVDEVELVNPPDEIPPTPKQLIRETARDAKDIPPLLSGSLMQSILTDCPYPIAFYQAILRRIRAEQLIDKGFRRDWVRALHRRMAAVKAVLIRNYKKEISVGLDVTRPEAAYHLGRWFALLEKVQKDALGENINATVKDRFYTAASSTPVTVFPRLISLSQHHLNKIEAKGLRIKREKQIQEIAQRLGQFPKHLTLEQQGLFHLGYYHQMQDLYAKKLETHAVSSTSESE